MNKFITHKKVIIFVLCGVLGFLLIDRLVAYRLSEVHEEFQNLRLPVSGQGVWDPKVPTEANFGKSSALHGIGLGGTSLEEIAEKWRVIDGGELSSYGYASKPSADKMKIMRKIIRAKSLLSVPPDEPDDVKAIRLAFAPLMPMIDEMVANVDCPYAYFEPQPASRISVMDRYGGLACGAVVQALWVLSECELAAGNGARVVEIVKVLLRLAECEVNEKKMVSNSHSGSIVGMTIRIIQRLLAKQLLNSLQLTQLITRLDRLGEPPFEAMLANEWLEMDAQYERFITGDGPPRQFFNNYNELGYTMVPDFYWNHQRVKHLRVFHELITTFRRTQSVPDLIAIGNRQRQIAESVATYNVGRDLQLRWLFYSRYLREYYFTIYLKKLVKVQLLLEKHRLQHRTFPSSLKELDGLEPSLVDVDSRPFRYEKIGQTYLLWSVGENGVDDWHGRRPPEDFPSGEVGNQPQLYFRDADWLVGQLERQF